MAPASPSPSCTKQPGSIPIAQGFNRQQLRGLAIQIHITHVANIKQKEFYSITVEFPTVQAFQ
ncbi:hypothetical protein ACLOJK_028249, partial [Asimina triloba]